MRLQQLCTKERPSQSSPRSFSRKSCGLVTLKHQARAGKSLWKPCFYKPTTCSVVAEVCTRPVAVELFKTEGRLLARHPSSLPGPANLTIPEAAFRLRILPVDNTILHGRRSGVHAIFCLCFRDRCSDRTKTILPKRPSPHCGCSECTRHQTLPVPPKHLHPGSLKC